MRINKCLVGFVVHAEGSGRVQRVSARTRGQYLHTRSDFSCSLIYGVTFRDCFKKCLAFAWDT
jgi:hypothetical protein